MDLTRCLHLAVLLLVPLFPNAATPVISTDETGSVFMHSDGSVWSVGNSSLARTATSPVRLFQLANTVTAISGNSAVYALLADGTLWSAGFNSVGQLGDGTTLRRDELQKIPGLADIKALAADASAGHVLALKRNGSVWSWGANRPGQLGDGTKTDRPVPGPVPGLTDVISVSAGEGTSLALKADGTVWVWGNIMNGQAGDGSILTGDATSDWTYLVPKQIPNFDQVTAVAAGAWHHMALRADKTVWVWGAGEFGENGTGTLTPSVLPTRIEGLDNVIAIAVAGFHYSAALKSDGTVWTFGSNSHGQLGVSGMTYSYTPVQVPGISDAVAISAGRNHMVAMRRDGSVLAWGWNHHGQLGDGTLQSRAEPRPVLGPGGTGRLNLLQALPAVVNQLPQVGIGLSVSSGRAPLTVQASALEVSDSDGTVRGYAWTSSDGQQASGASPSFTFSQSGTYEISLLAEDDAGGRGFARKQVTVLPPEVPIVTSPKVRVGYASGVALANSGRVLTWGAAWMIGLFDPEATRALHDTNSLPIANGITGAVDISIESAAHALLADGTLLGWGQNESGQIGADNRQTQLSQPQRIPNLPVAQALATGYRHGLALTRDGRVFAWGSNVNGQLGVGDYENRFAPVEVAGLSNVLAIVAGGRDGISAALRSDGSVWAWGDNSQYQLGDATRISRNRPIQVPALTGIARIFATSSNIFAQRADGSVWVTGPLYNAAVGDPGPEAGARRAPVFDGFAQIAGGGRHIVARKSDGTVWTGGMQDTYGLGLPNSGDISGLQQLPGITDAIWVAAADRASVALRRDGTILGWGRNASGELGNGTIAIQRTPALMLNETGDGFLDLIPEVNNAIAADTVPLYFLAAKKNTDNLGATLTDPRASGFTGSVYFTGLLPSGSPLLAPPSGSSANGFSAGGGMVPVNFGRGGVKQTGPGVIADPAATQTLTSGNSFAAYSGASKDPLLNSNAIICMGVTVDGLSAKGQVLMRPIATGDQVQGVVQCPTVQTASTAKSYTATASGSLNNRSLGAQIVPQPEDRGQLRNIYSWAVAPNGMQFMQTANGWAMMADPMQPAMTLTVPTSGNIAFPVLSNVDLTALAGTLVYIGIGSSWQEVSQLNKAGHYYTVQ